MTLSDKVKDYLRGLMKANPDKHYSVDGIGNIWEHTPTGTMNIGHTSWIDDDPQPMTMGQVGVAQGIGQIPIPPPMPDAIKQHVQKLLDEAHGYHAPKPAPEPVETPIHEMTLAAYRRGVRRALYGESE